MNNPHVLLSTSLGDLLLELYSDKAPATVENFLRYVDDGHYNGAIFHRVVRGFVIQGGGYDRSLNKIPARPPIHNEAANGLSNELGTVAMARALDKDSAADEFFINATDNPALDHQDDTDAGYGYCVFGKVVDGLDVVKKINWKVTKSRSGFDDLPVDEIEILSVQRFE